jgi:hypothetical protein
MMQDKTVALLLLYGRIACAGSLLLIAGCSSVVEMDPVASTARFTGHTDKGESVHVTLTLRDDSAVGRGELNGKPFVLSAVRCWQGKGTLGFVDGTTSPVTIELAQDQNGLLLTSQNGEGQLTRSGDAEAEWGKELSGEFASDSEIPLRVNLLQMNDMIVGTGYHAGQPVAVNGTRKDKQVIATLAFADESLRRVSADVANDGNTLVVSGLGASIELRRVRR